MLPDFFQTLFRILGRSVASGLRKLYGHQCKPLANIVMQISRDAAALFLLRFDEAMKLALHLSQPVPLKLGIVGDNRDRSGVRVQMQS
jgi:hypothetical protein